jgi:hypothetical protein
MRVVDPLAAERFAMASPAMGFTDARRSHGCAASIILSKRRPIQHTVECNKAFVSMTLLHIASGCGEVADCPHHGYIHLFLPDQLSVICYSFVYALHVRHLRASDQLSMVPCGPPTDGRERTAHESAARAHAVGLPFFPIPHDTHGFGLRFSHRQVCLFFLGDSARLRNPTKSAAVQNTPSERW